MLVLLSLYVGFTEVGMEFENGVIVLAGRLMTI